MGVVTSDGFYLYYFIHVQVCINNLRNIRNFLGGHVPTLLEAPSESGAKVCIRNSMLFGMYTKSQGLYAELLQGEHVRLN